MLNISHRTHRKQHSAYAEMKFIPRLTQFNMVFVVAVRHVYQRKQFHWCSYAAYTVCCRFRPSYESKNSEKLLQMRMSYLVITDYRQDWKRF